MERLRNAVIIVAVAAAVALMAGCEKGPVQKAGERVDRAFQFRQQLQHPIRFRCVP